jgi:hypothetical protein
VTEVNLNPNSRSEPENNLVTITTQIEKLTEPIVTSNTKT